MKLNPMMNRWAISNLEKMKSFFNNRMVGVALAPETFKVGSKGWDWSMGSIQDP